nr:uncharacterized protein LOC129427310 isoform X2 [Misgurnus anguillicaudatus]XP_055039673.1 uncharacterized protein LOC129427310 isoform X2 [Misgurnus anguillicaudatus]
MGSFENFDDLFLKNLSLFYLKLQGQFLLAASTIQNIVDEMQNIHELGQTYTVSKLHSLLQNDLSLPEETISKILATVKESDLFSMCHKGPLRTVYSRSQAFKKVFSYVEPKRILLGRDENRKEQFAYYVPVKETLRCLLNSDIGKNYISMHLTENNSDILCDCSDGQILKCRDFSEDNPSLQLLLYQDAFEVVNPLGSARKKHKILAVYLSLVNLPAHLRSNTEHMQLVMLCREKDFKDFGHESVFSQLVADLKDLEENGISLSDQSVIKGSLYCIAGDNLGSHCIGGFTENFSQSKYFCRYCLITKDEFQSVDPNSCGPLRTVEGYESAVKQLQTEGVTEVQGIKFSSVFSSLKNFKVCQPGLPPCLGHDVFEGVLSYDVVLYLKYFVKKKWFTYPVLNRRICQFKYSGSDALSKPCEVSPHGLKLAGQAIQNWNFLRLLPVILSDRVLDPADEVWQLTLQLKEIVELICAQKISVSQVAYLDVLIQEYLESRKAAFPEVNLRPKHHYLRHYPVMDESQQRNVTSAIVRVLPDLSSSVLASVVETLNSLGVTTPEDFQYVQEADLLPVLRHIQARKLVSVLGQNQQSTGCGSTSAENSDSHLASCSSSSSHLVKVSKVPLDWADNFKIPWQKLPEEIIHCLEKKKRLSPRLRREMIRIVVSDMLKVCDGPSKQSSTTIAKKMVAKYPASLQDVIEGEIVGSGYHSLVKQLQNRVENIKRSYVPKIRKRNRTEDSDTDEIPGEKKAAVQDTYGCVNWELKLMPLSETKESQLDKQEQMKMMSTTANPDPEVVSSLLKATYYTQRRDINNGTSMQQLCETWPFLFREVGMCVHFKLLTGIDLKEMLFNSLDKKGKRLLNFLKTVGAERKKRVLQAAAKLEVMRGQIEGCSEDIKDLVLLLLAYFDEKEEMMFHYVEESCLVEDVQLDKLPATPCIVVCGSSCYTSKLFMVSIDQRITTPHISTFISAICIMFGSFYCFNIHYPLELGSTLEFLQRCFFSINPEKGTKVEWKKNKKQLPVNPRVLTLIADLADHEWRAD